jgi:hypothetical protein
MNSELTIEIGGTPVLFHFSDPALAELIRNRFADFVRPTCGKNPIEFTVELGDVAPPDGNEEGRLPGADVEYADGVWRFHRPDLRAEWRPETRKAWLRQTSRITNAVDSILRMVHSILSIGSGGCLMHAASVAHNGNGYVFTGVSGAGKTTISGLRPAGATLLTDEMSYLLPDGLGYTLHGTPFASRTGSPGSNTSAPLKAVHLLAKGPEHKVELLARKAAMAVILRNTLFYAKDPALARRAFETAGRIVDCVPVYRLTFAPTADVWEIIR